MQQLYVCSRPLLGKDGELHQHLIGILKKLDNDEYQFEYRLDDSIESNRLILSIFPDRHKVYNDAETRVLLDDYFPSENDTAFITEILKKSGLDHYDEWTWLLTFDSDDANAETFLYETLPDEIIRHDDDFIDDDIDDDSLDEEKQNDYPEDNLNKTDDSFDDMIFEKDSFIDDLLLDESKGNFGKNDIENEPEPEDEDDEFDIELPDDDFSDVLDSFEDDSTEIETVIHNDTSIIKSASLIKNLDPKPKNTIKTITVQTTYKREKRHDVEDFIEPPPESPIEKIQQRLLDNQKLRQERLAEQLKNSPYTN